MSTTHHSIIAYIYHIALIEFKSIPPEIERLRSEYHITLSGNQDFLNWALCTRWSHKTLNNIPRLSINYRLTFTYPVLWCETIPLGPASSSVNIIKNTCIDLMRNYSRPFHHDIFSVLFISFPPLPLTSW